MRTYFFIFLLILFTNLPFLAANARFETPALIPLVMQVQKDGEPLDGERIGVIVEIQDSEGNLVYETPKVVFIEAINGLVRAEVGNTEQGFPPLNEKFVNTVKPLTLFIRLCDENLVCEELVDDVTGFSGIPLLVGSKALNADRLDGFESTDFVRWNQKIPPQQTDFLEDDGRDLILRGNASSPEANVFFSSDKKNRIFFDGSDFKVQKGSTTFTLGAGAGSGGGDITSVTAGNGLTGGGTSGDVTLHVAAGRGIMVVDDRDRLELDQNVEITWTANHDWDLTGSERLQIRGQDGGATGLFEIRQSPLGSTATSTYGLHERFFNNDDANVETHRLIAISIDNDGVTANDDIRAIEINNGVDSTADVDTAIRIENADTDTAIVTGIDFVIGSGGMTTALNVSDPEITNALNIGPNVLLGTTATIDFTNFDVQANGDVVSAGNYRRSVVDGIDVTGDTVQGSEPLTKDINRVTLCDAGGTSGPTLPPANAGLVITVINSCADTILLFPAAGDFIDGKNLDAPITLFSNDTAVCHALDTTLWWCGRMVRED